MNNKNKKVAVLFSGGLDSRLAIKLLQEEDFDVIALHFKMPFSKDVELDIRKFCNSQNVKLKVFDYSKRKMFKEYLELLKNPKHGRGAGVNPCVDCRLFMIKKAKEFIDKNNIEFLATGEVIGQRPMSQRGNSIKLIEEKSGLKGRILRPLMERGIKGRSRSKQIKLAESFDINYPNPAGGCLLCEKALVNRFSHFFKRGLKPKEADLINRGRHFLIDNNWVVLGRNEEENNLIEDIGEESQLVFSEKSVMGPTAIILDEINPDLRDKVRNIVMAYSKEGSLEDRKKFKKYKL